jgi:hypothetical protein
MQAPTGEPFADALAALRGDLTIMSRRLDVLAHLPAYKFGACEHASYAPLEARHASSRIRYRLVDGWVRPLR